VALALYRKYRPRTFSEVIGQEHVTGPLMQALRGDRLHHAYLFSGPRGCGKTSSARILARSLNCERGPTPDPCGVCDSCVALAPDGPGSIDVIEIDAASHGGVDDARDLRERAIFAPVSSRFKVYVIDEAHMVSSAGFNALLKLVEEPPDYVKFVFATTEPEKVLGTIKSRTHHYPFRLIPPGVLRPYLEQLCKLEGVSVEPAVFPLVVRAGGGSARDSLSVLDQLIAGAGPDGVTYAGAVALLGVTDVALIDEACDALAAGDGATAFATIDRVVDAGHDPRRFAADLLERLRDLIVMQQVPDAAGKGLLDAPEDELTRMAAQAERFGPATLSRMADIVHTGLTEMRGTTAPRLLLELITARMLLPGADGSATALLQRLERMERRLTVTTDPTPPPEPAPPAAAPPPPAAAPPAAAPSPTAQPPAAEPPRPPAIVASSAPQGGASAPRSTPGAGSAPGVVDAAAVRRVWDEVLTIVGRKSKKVAAWAREASVRDVDHDTLVLVFRHSFHASALAADPELLVGSVHEVLGGAWQIRCEVAGQPAAAATPPVAAPPVTQPVTAQPAAPAQARTPTPRGTAAVEDGDWPTTARPGGTASATSPAPAPPATAESKPARSRAAGGRQAARSRPGRPAAARPKDGAGPWEGSDEPPYDPDYDPPVRDARGYEGFDPGDEPGDEVVDERTARQTSEQQALQLLQQTLGAEKIGEVDAR
jgi:DNA polymerase III subunit gamma/tau